MNTLHKLLESSKNRYHKQNKAKLSRVWFWNIMYMHSLKWGIGAPALHADVAHSVSLPNWRAEVIQAKRGPKSGGFPARRTSYFVGILDRYGVIGISIQNQLM